MNTKFEKVRRTQIALFRDSGLANDEFDGLIDLFSPENIADFLGLRYREVDSIPSIGLHVMTAGILDRPNKTILVSKEFPSEQRRLTGMHEVIHWMCHEEVGRNQLHRDRPIGFFQKSQEIDLVEWEATNFACQYLMTDRMVKEKFADSFKIDLGARFPFNENTAFYLGVDVDRLSKMSLRERSTKLATVSRFGRDILPMYKCFKVSPTAMAIRLEELGLVSIDCRSSRPNLKVVR